MQPNEHEKQRERMIPRAEHILEKIMHRQRWAAEDRDRLAEYLKSVANREIGRARKGR